MLFTKEKERRENVIFKKNFENPFLKTLLLAADQFIVNRGDGLKTIIAGYHWFSDWGRDTMIALPGLCLTTGRLDDAKNILRAFAANVSQGMIPNRFPDSGEAPEYNTIDATLWFFIAVFRFKNAANDADFVLKELLPVLRDCMTWHINGTRYDIHADSDGLLTGGESGEQLTWMDARVGGKVITPRTGKAVEINALWYNAMIIFAELLKENGETEEAEIWLARAERTKLAFKEFFWNDAKKCLFDYGNPDFKNDSIRPNQLFAISLPFPLIEGDEAGNVLKIVEEKLLTPVGLRSLSQDDAEYHGHYGGNQWERDSAYHQGTVWSWLLGPYIDALLKIRGEDGRNQANHIIDGFKKHLGDACIGSVSEIFDGDFPHSAQGCVAQAWSVGEILRVCVEYGLVED